MRGEIITPEEMLAIPAYEISDLSQIPSAPLVSVIVITYNHEAYIEQAIEGILAQQCDFPIELIIGEDKSQDRTLEICRDYQKRIPHLIRIVTWHENVGPNANYLRCWGRARGKYVAICEGDDYWIDPDKLTKQVAFMEASPDTMLSGALVRMLDNSTGLFYEELFGPIQMKEQYGLEDVIVRQCFHTSTFLFRAADFKIPACARSVFCLDTILMSAASLQGSLRCISDTLSVYRLHGGGIITGLDWIRKYEKLLQYVQALQTFVDVIYMPVISKQKDIIRLFLCHELVSNGELTRARALALKIVWRLTLQSPTRAFGLILHVYLPRTFRHIFDAWSRYKRSCAK
jgi:glycosyltransferase involved in cell wall biosynthesis